MLKIPKRFPSEKFPKTEQEALDLAQKYFEAGRQQESSAMIELAKIYQRKAKESKRETT